MAQQLYLGELKKDHYLEGWSGIGAVGASPDIVLKVVRPGDTPMVDIEMLFGETVEGNPVTLLGSASSSDLTGRAYELGVIRVGEYIVIDFGQGPRLLDSHPLRAFSVTRV